jgi:Zn-dependent alcohol dehydrogenase
LQDFQWNKSYSTVLYGGCVPQRDFREIFSLYVARKLKLDELISSFYDFDDIPRAFDDVQNGRTAKAVIRMG